MKFKKLLGLTTVFAASALLLAACGAKEETGTTIKVGVMSLTDTEEARWDKVQEILDEKDLGIKLEFTQFTEYTQPNQAVNNGELDINAFQHYNFLNNWNDENDANLQVVAETYISPIRLYSGLNGDKNKYKSVKDIPANGSIVIPNDATNESRALYLLESAGLVKLDVSGDELATIANVKDTKLTITELDASQTARNLESADAGVVNNTFVIDAGLDFKKALFVEEQNENSKQWYNVIVAQEGWEDSDKAEAIKAIVDAYHTDEVKTVIEETSEGMDQPVW